MVMLFAVASYIVVVNGRMSRNDVRTRTILTWEFVSLAVDFCVHLDSLYNKINHVVHAVSIKICK